MRGKRKNFCLISTLLLICIMLIGCGGKAEQSLDELLSLGQKYLQEENYEDAIVAFEKAIKIDDRCVEAYIGLADAYIGTGDIEKAIEVLEKGYAKTNDKDINLKLLELDENNDTSEADDDIEQSEDIIATGTIIDNSDYYLSQYYALCEQYGDLSIDAFGIRFSDPIEVSIGNKKVEISESGISSSDRELDTDMFFSEGYKEKYFNKELKLKGHFTELDEEFDENGVFYHDNSVEDPFPIYSPNGKYTFYIIEIIE